MSNSSITKKVTPTRNHSYTNNNTRATKHKQDNYRCMCRYITGLIEKRCEKTNNWSAVSIAMQIHPDITVGITKDYKARVCWPAPDAMPRALIQAAQKHIANDYWLSKKWSSNTQKILTKSKHLSGFGRGLYERMLEAEKYKRYRCKRLIRKLEEIYG